MPKKKPDKKLREFLETMQRERGEVPAVYAYAAPKDFGFVEAYDNLYKAALYDGKALPAKMKELVVLGIVAFRGLDGACYAHLKRALDLGATKEEALEAIEAMIVVGGTPTFRAGIRALMRIDEEEENRKTEMAK